MTDSHFGQSLAPTEFRDSHDSVWDAKISVAAAKRVDSVDYSALTREKFSLLRPMDGLQGFFGEILTNTGFLFAVLFDLMIKQVASNLDTDPFVKRDQAEMEFSERMGGEQITTARSALWRALEDFFPDQRTVLQALWENYEEGQQKIEEELQTMVPEVSELLKERMQSEAQKLKESLLREIRG